MRLACVLCDSRVCRVSAVRSLSRSPLVFTSERYAERVCMSLVRSYALRGMHGFSWMDERCSRQMTVKSRACQLVACRSWFSMSIRCLFAQPDEMNDFRNIYSLCRSQYYALCAVLSYFLQFRAVALIFHFRIFAQLRAVNAGRRFLFTSCSAVVRTENQRGSESVRLAYAQHKRVCVCDNQESD